MAQISIANLSFCYDGSYDPVFENVSFQIDTDWKLGFTGRNGRGKTTFLRLLMGEYEYKGTITAPVAFEFFPFGVDDRTDNTGTILSRLCPDRPEWEIVRELSLLDLPRDILYRPFDTLSGGEQTKTLLAALFLRGVRFLLIDEPTNHLDGEARELVSRYLNAKKGFILVSHDRAFLDRCTDHTLSINKTDIECQKGSFSAWYANKEARDNFERAENEKLSKEIGKLKASAKQSGQWADKGESTKIGKGGASIEKNINSRAYIGEKSRRMQQRRKNLERRQSSAIEEKSDLLKNLEKTESLKIAQLPYHTDRLVSLSEVSIRYGETVVCQNVSFTIEKGDRIALSGKNGSGKSSILKLICGEPLEYSGELQLGSRLVISHAGQDASALSGNLSESIDRWGIDETLFKTILRKLDFSREQFEKDMGDYSGGQKKKVLLAKSLCEKAHLHIWDEPLNFIDIYSRMQIEELLQACKPTLLFVEHDSVFRDTVANKRITL